MDANACTGALAPRMRTFCSPSVNAAPHQYVSLCQVQESLAVHPGYTPVSGSAQPGTSQHSWLYPSQSASNRGYRPAAERNNPTLHALEPRSCNIPRCRVQVVCWFWVPGVARRRNIPLDETRAFQSRSPHSHCPDSVASRLVSPEGHPCVSACVSQRHTRPRAPPTHEPLVRGTSLAASKTGALGTKYEPGSIQTRSSWYGVRAWTHPIYITCEPRTPMS